MIYTRALIAVSASIFAIGLLLVLVATGYCLLGQSEVFSSTFGWVPISAISKGFGLMGWALIAGCLGEIGLRMLDLHTYFLGEITEDLEDDPFTTSGDDAKYKTSCLGMK